MKNKEHFQIKSDKVKKKDFAIQFMKCLLFQMKISKDIIDILKLIV